MAPDRDFFVPAIRATHQYISKTRYGAIALIQIGNEILWRCRTGYDTIDWPEECFSDIISFESFLEASGIEFRKTIP